MYKKELDSLLSKPNHLPRAYLLYGASEFYIAHYGSKIAKLLLAGQGAEGQEVQRFYFEECDINQIYTLLSQNSLFGDKSFLLLRLDKKLDKKTCEKLLGALANNMENALIIEFYASSAKSSAQYMQDCRAFVSNFKSPKIPVAEVRFFEPSLSECMQILQERTKELNIALKTEDLRYILELQNNNIAIALKELEKFCIGVNSSETKQIESQSVRFLSEGVASFSVEELTCAIMEKKPFLKILQTIYEEGIDEMSLIREVERFFYQLFLFFSYIKTKGAPNAAEILGFSPPRHIIERQSRYCISLREQDYAKIFELLNQWHVECMSGKSKNGMTTLIKIQAMLR